MKIRNGFVSNSSSSSFIISTFNLSPKQIQDIYNHNEIWQKLDQDVKEKYDMWFDDTWEITKKDGFLRGSTSMDNFNMHGFLEMIGVDKLYVQWED